MGGILETIINWIVHLLYVPVEAELHIIASAGQLWNIPTSTQLPWFGTMLGYTQGVAVAVLGARVAYEAFLLSSLRGDGETGSLSGLLKRTIAAIVGITLGPILAQKAVEMGNDLGQLIAGTPLVPPITNLSNALSGMSAASSAAFWGTVMEIPTLILILLIFIQAAVRSIEFLIIVLASPLMALGFISGGGTADIWWREVVVIACTQAVQLTGLFIGIAAMTTPMPFGPGASYLTPFAAIAALWVAFRTPSLLRQFTYHSGMGSAAGGAAQMGASVVMRMLPF